MNAHLLRQQADHVNTPQWEEFKVGPFSAANLMEKCLSAARGGRYILEVNIGQVNSYVVNMIRGTMEVHHQLKTDVRWDDEQNVHLLLSWVE